MPTLLRDRVGPHAAQHRQKRRTKRHNSRTDPDLPPPRFWDNLSHIPLVKRALQELDRRNNTLQPQGQEGLNPPGDPRQLEARINHQDIKRFSRTGGPDLSDLRGYAYNPTESPPRENRGRRQHRSTMPGRGSTYRGRASGSGLGKRRRDTANESAESEDETGASGQRRNSQPRARARGRNRGHSVNRRSVAAVRDKSTTSTTTVASTKSGPYDHAFTMHLLDNHILPLEYDPPEGKKPEPPDNMHEIEAEIGAIRAPEPAEDFQLFRTEYRRCSNEDGVLKLLDTLEGDRAALLQSHVIRHKQMMSNLTPLTNGTIKPGNPDRVYGAAASKLDQDVRQKLDGKVVPTREKDFICPNFVVHVKGDSGSMKVARRQAAYDGALAARGMQALWDFADGPDDIRPGVHTRGSDRGRGTAVFGPLLDNLEDSNPTQGQAQVARVARTITCTWSAGVLRMYATHCEMNPDTEEGVHSSEQAPHEFPIYVPTLIDSWIMTDKETQFLRGLTAYRNGLDWAKKQRDEAISRANARARAERVRRRRVEKDLGREHIADEQDHSEPRENCVENGGGSRSIYARRVSETREQDEEDQFEGEGTSEEDDVGSSSIFARRRSNARRQDEEADEEDEENDMADSFSSQRTVTTRSMSRKQQSRLQESRIR